MKNIFFSLLLLATFHFSFSQITLSTTVTNVSCFGGSNGSATVSATGGNGSYTYTWIPSGNTTNIITGLAAGQYSVLVQDLSANTASAIINIGQPSQLNSNISTQPSCFGNCSGFAYVFASGGTAPYTYSWSPNVFQNAPQANFLCPGMYSVQIIDANNCVSTQSVNIMQSPPITVSLTANNTTCGLCTGSISATIYGGTPVYTYYWTMGATTPSVQNLCTGTYNLTVTDAMGCSASASANVLNSNVGTLTGVTTTLTSYQETCLNSGDGSIDLSIGGSNPGPFSYQWSNGYSSQDIVNVSSGVYFVTISDNNSNCITLSDTVTADGTNCGTISGNVFLDVNNDCIKNTGDLDISNSLLIANPGNRYAYPNALGFYTFSNLPYGTYSISSSYYPSILTPTCSTTINSTINSSSQNSNNNNLAFNSIAPSQPDMSVYAYSNGIVPGFQCYVNYYLTNHSYFNGSGILKAQLPSSIMSNFISASPATYTISGDTIMWNYSNISYYSYNNFTVSFTVPVNTPLGSIFSTCFWAQTSTTDFYPANNSGCYQRGVTGSFDPNDKSVSPVGVGANGGILATETDFTYLIRFQNTGNGPAVNIVVKDTLSPNLNINSFEMLSASHNYNIEILPGNILKWKFNNIMLPDSNSNEPASHGYIQYRIKRNNNNTPGTEIKNTAYIYFDFNEPVVTNTTLNTIIIPTDINSVNHENNNWLVYPNPNQGMITITNTSTQLSNTDIEITNAIGSVILKEKLSVKSKTIDLTGLSEGIYFIKINSENKTSIHKIILTK